MDHIPHISVLPGEVLRELNPHSGGLYCDGTLGAGGHTRLVLEASAPDSRVIAVDRDPVALETARERLGDLADRVQFVHGRYSELRENLEAAGVTTVSGFVLDLGMSSMQLDDGERGFSFSLAGPLDMRMDRSRGRTALELIRETSADSLASILRDYGEERFSRRIAERMVEAADAGALATTADLANLVARSIPAKSKRGQRIHPATRTFQALRIAVNGELDELTSFLANFVDALEPGGRCVIISFHSLEDRLVKRRFRELAWSSSLPPDLARRAGERVDPICKVLTKRAVTASPEEVASNPRSRSAKLRACEKLAA